MGLSGNQKAIMYALGGLARGGATRGGYHSGLPYLSIGGAVTDRVLVSGLSVRDILDETPNTCQLTVMDTAAPPPGAELVITLGSVNSGTRVFAGKILSEQQGYLAQKPANVYHQLNGIDYTWLLGQHLVIRQYTNQTVGFIATDLITSFAEGITAHHIAADAGAILIDAISFTNVALADALTQLCSRAGAYWYLDYFRDLHLFETEPTTVYPDPTPLTPAHPSLADLTVTQDLSQLVTRALVEGGGGTVLVDLQPGETILPLDTSGWYQPGGGQVTSGAQRLTYAGVSGGAGGIGSLVGPGVTPSTLLGVTLALGAGVTIGLHDYAVSYLTAAGESLTGPRTTINVTGLLAPPAVAPTPTAQSGGAGPEAGAHYYATTFVTASGETAPSAATWYMQNSIAAGTTAIPIQDDVTGFGLGDLRPGDTVALKYQYASAPLNAGGGVDPPNATGLGLTAMSPPSAAYTIKVGSGGNGQGFRYTVPYSPDLNVKTLYVWISHNGAPYVIMAMGWSKGGWGYGNAPGVGSVFLSYVSGSMGTITPPVSVNPIVGGVLVSGIAIGPAGVTARKLYRSTTYTAAPLLLLATLADNTTTTYLDAKVDASLGATAPAVGTAAAAQVAVSGIALGPASVTGRRVYRTAAGGSQLKVLATLADNTTTTYLDALADASLGANAPPSDTSGIQQPAGTVLAGSPSLLLAGISAAFSATGGWAIVGNGEVVIRYTGFSGNSLVGIPPTGVGSITTSISYGALCTAAPQLLGIPASGPGSIQYALHNGDEINLLVTVDDVNAQQALAALIGGSGILEAYIQDRRIGYAEALARGQAMLEERSTVLVEVRYTCRDPLTRSGATIHCAMPAPTNLAGDYKIQDVTIANFSAKPGQPPTYTVQASSQRYSLDDLLRMARGTIGA